MFPRQAIPAAVSAILATLTVLCGARLGPEPLAGRSLAEGYWDVDLSGPILERTRRIRLDPDLSALTDHERAAVKLLLEAGGIFQRLYEISRHEQALESFARLEALDEELGGARAARNLLDLYRLFQGPIATTLDNRREAFLPVLPEVPGKNVYPRGPSREDLDAWIRDRPDRAGTLLHPRTVVREADAKRIAEDIRALDSHPALDTLHPGLRGRLAALAGAGERAGYYAVAYSLAYADDLLEAHGLLRRAAAILERTDPDFSAYLENRARDLLSNDYESGDASWVSGRFGKLNAQIGSYETYDDELYGVKSFFGFSLLLRDGSRTRKLEGAVKGIQRLEESLPYPGHKKVRSDIPVGVYDVIADFGQARGTNTASILPNESHIVRKYGRTILLRANIMLHPDLFEDARAAFAAAVTVDDAHDLTPDGDFERTLWHEIGHYLGPDRTSDGRSLDVALSPWSDLIEEMKADLVSLYLAPALTRQGYLDQRGLRAVQASGIRRVLQRVKPRRTQPYQTMQLMQMNFYLENGLLEWDDGRLGIDRAVYHDVVGSLLEKVLAIQLEGDPARAARFVERYGGWEEELHGSLARRIDQASGHRFRLVRYGALGE